MKSTQLKWGFYMMDIKESENAPQKKQNNALSVNSKTWFYFNGIWHSNLTLIENIVLTLVQRIKLVKPEKAIQLENYMIKVRSNWFTFHFLGFKKNCNQFLRIYENKIKKKTLNNVLFFIDYFYRENRFRY